MSEPSLTKAVLVKIVNGKRGYLVMRANNMPGESITCSPRDWVDPQGPCTGIDVLIQGMERRRGGWRAVKARRLQPEDNL